MDKLENKANISTTDVEFDGKIVCLKTKRPQEALPSSKQSGINGTTGDGAIPGEESSLSLKLPPLPKKKKSTLMSKRFLFENCCRILTRHPHWRGRFGYDVRDECPTLDGRRISDADEGMIRRWFSSKMKLNPGKDTVHEAVKQAFMGNMYDPVKILLDNLPAWDGIDRLPLLLEKMHIHIYNPTYSKYAHAWWKCWLISAVKRVYEPGCKADDAPVLWGKQGLYKTTFFYKLFYDKVSVTSINLNDHRQSVMALYGVWCFLLDEVKNVTRNDQTVLNSFLSKTDDRYDKKFSKYTDVRQRMNVFGASVNEPKMFRERGGLRRFHFFKCIKQIDFVWIEHNRDQLWSQVKTLYKASEKSYLTDPVILKVADKSQQKIGIINEVWEDEVRAYCKDHPTSAKLTSREIKDHLRHKHYTIQSDKQLGNGMRNLGATPTKDSGERAWTNPFFKEYTVEWD